MRNCVVSVMSVCQSEYLAIGDRKKRKIKGWFFVEGEGKGFVAEGIFLQVVWERGGDGIRKSWVFNKALRCCM